MTLPSRVGRSPLGAALRSTLGVLTRVGGGAPVARQESTIRVVLEIDRVACFDYLTLDPLDDIPTFERVMFLRHTVQVANGGFLRKNLLPGMSSGGVMLGGEPTDRLGNGLIRGTGTSIPVDIRASASTKPVLDTVANGGVVKFDTDDTAIWAYSNEPGGGAGGLNFDAIGLTVSHGGAAQDQVAWAVWWDKADKPPFPRIRYSVYGRIIYESIS